MMLLKNMRDFIVRGLCSSDGKILLSNFFYLTLLKIAGYVFPLLTLPYLAKVIGVNGFGKLAFASAIIVWFETFADWGFNYTATRDMARCRGSLKKQSVLFSNILWARLFLLLISFIVLLLLLLCVSMFWECRVVILLTFLLIPGKIFFPEWYFQAIEEMRYITYLNVFSKLIFTLGVFVFVKSPNDYILQPLFISLGFIFSGICSMYIILKKKRLYIYMPKKKSILRTIKSSTNIFINNLMPNLYGNFSIVLLNFLHGPSFTGVYSAGKKISTIVADFMDIINRVFFPFLARKIGSHSKYALFTIILVTMSSILLFICSPLIIRIFYTEEFMGAVLVLQITSLAIPFVFLDGIYGVNYMILMGKDKVLMKMTIFSSVLGFIVSFPLIYFYDYVGTALTYFIASFFIGLLPLLYVKRIIKFS